MKNAEQFSSEVIDGELDRMSVENPHRSMYGADSVRVTDKRITFESKSHSYPGRDWAGKEYVPYKRQLLIEKICTKDEDHVEFEMKKFERKSRSVQCNLGHEHKEEFYDFDHWERLILSWEDMEKLVEWFNSGRFYDPRTRQARVNNAKQGYHSKQRIK